MRNWLPMYGQTGKRRGDYVVKLVISDMDGTLIDRDEVLSEKAVNIVHALKEKGIMFTIATGRVECMADKYIKKLGITIPYIACNGATIVDQKRVLKRNKIPLKGLRNIVEQADRMNMSLVYCIDGNETVYKVTPWIIEQRETFHRYFDTHIFTEKEWESLYIDKLMIMDDVREGAIGVLEELCKKLPDMYGFTRYTNKAVEIVNKNSTKASALQILAQYLDINLEDILAIGDHQNDIEMLREAGIGVAVGNATEEAKKAADFVAHGCCIDGVEEAVKKYCHILV